MKALPVEKVILPTLLYEELRVILEREESKIFPSILRAWLPFYSMDHIKAIVTSLTKDEEYLNILNEFFKIFNPEPATEFTSDMEKLGRESIFKREIIEKLGHYVGEILFELLAVSQKLKAIIICFGERTISLIQKFNVSIIRALSRLKKQLKAHTNIRRTIRLVGYIITLDALRDFINVLGLMNFPYINDIGVGLIVVANG